MPPAGLRVEKRASRRKEAESEAEAEAEGSTGVEGSGGAEPMKVHEPKARMETYAWGLTVPLTHNRSIPPCRGARKRDEETEDGDGRNETARTREEN